MLAVVAGAALVFAGSLGYFFSQDDFAGLARARGLREPYPGAWRWLSGTAYFALMRPLGLNAFAYHAVNLLAHAACAGILFALLRRRFSAPAALLGALFFGAHPALYTAVYWISTLNEILALLFALLAIACAGRPDAVAWAAVPLFALSLLSKETTLFLPLALWVPLGWLEAPGGALRAPSREGVPTAGSATGGGQARGPAGSEAPATDAARRGPAGVRIALSALAAIYLAYWVLGDLSGTRANPEASAPYAVGPGRHVLDNVVSYLGWTANMLLLTTRRFEDAAEPGLWPWAVAVVALWLAGLLLPRLRARGWLAGGLTFAALIAPVAGLRNHTYHYYLYAPLIGAAWCMAALADAWFRVPAASAVPAAAVPRGSSSAVARGRTTRAPGTPAGMHGGAPQPPDRRASGAGTRIRGLAWPLALSGAALLLLNGALLVRKIENMPFVGGMLRADPIVDRARIARRTYDGLAAAGLPDRARLVFWSPASMRYELRLHPGADVIGRETYWERNVRAALQEGLAVRVMFPRVDSVTFIHAYRAAAPETRFVLYEPDGAVTVETPARLDSLMRQAAPAR